MLKRILTISFLLAISFFITSCNNENAPKLEYGNYITSDKIAEIELYSNYEYSINIIYIDRIIVGSYTVEKNKLLLYDNRYELVFLVEEDKIIFTKAFIEEKEEEWILTPGKEFFFQEIVES